MRTKLGILELPKVEESRGNITFIEGNKHIPFRIGRVYWIYDVPGGKVRSGHAYKKNKEFIIALSGSFDIIVNDGKSINKFSLNRSYFGLYVPEMLWRSLENFSTNSLCLILASEAYTEKDYIRKWNEYKKIVI